ncbi:MAG TPA: MarR family transcriptional regulator [Actinomycetota bacterium]
MDQPLSRMLLESYRSVEEETVAALADRGELGLSPSQAAALLLVDRSGTRLTELAARAQITKQAMMQVVDDLETAGSVRRVPDPTDARAKVVRLTARGLRQRAEARKAISAVEARTRRRLGARRYDTLRETLVALLQPD